MNIPTPNVVLDDAARNAYGPEYKEHLLSQYRLYVEMADRVSQRRHIASSFFVTLNTALVAFFQLMAQAASAPALILGGVLGASLCAAWIQLLQSYRNLNTAKYKVITSLERVLPAAPYHTEWEQLGEGKDPKLYTPLTYVEVVVPVLFMGAYIAVVVFRFL